MSKLTKHGLSCFKLGRTGSCFVLGHARSSASRSGAPDDLLDAIRARASSLAMCLMNCRFGMNPCCMRCTSFCATVLSFALM
eukprot:877652-Pyramimonas_sp.AAC.1